MFPKLKLPNFPDYPSTPTCHLGRNTSNMITTMPAKKSCMMIRMAQVPPLSRTTPGRLVKPIEHLLKKMLSKPSPQIVKPLLQNSPHIYIPTIYGAFFSPATPSWGHIFFIWGFVAGKSLAPWPCWYPLLFEVQKIPFPSGQFHEGCHTCRSWRRPRPGFPRSFQRWKHEVTGDLFPIPSYSPASPIVMSIPNLRSHRKENYSYENIPPRGWCFFRNRLDDGWIRNRSAHLPSPSPPSAQPQLLRSMEECTVFLQCLIHINNPVNQNLQLTSPVKDPKRTAFQGRFGRFLGLLFTC